MTKQNVIFSEENNNVLHQDHNDGFKRFIPYEKIKNIIETAYKEGVKDTITKTHENTRLEKEGHDKGIIEQAKEETKKQKNAKEKLQNLTSRQDITLLEIKTFFPFDLFPDTLHIDTTKLTIISREFFWTERIITISFKDILDVVFEKSLFLGNLTISYLPKSESMGMIKPKTYKIQLLKCEEARKAKNILKGILLTRREGVDVSQIEPNELKTMIERFGVSSAESPNKIILTSKPS